MISFTVILALQLTDFAYLRNITKKHLPTIKLVSSLKSIVVEESVTLKYYRKVLFSVLTKGRFFHLYSNGLSIKYDNNYNYQWSIFLSILVTPLFLRELDKKRHEEIITHTNYWA